MKLVHSTPALPISDLEKSRTFYQEMLGFEEIYTNEGLGIFGRDSVEIHLWVATDTSWRNRKGGNPVVSGAESFIAGTASCRVCVEDVDALYAELRPRGIVHPKGDLKDQWYGDREFAILDPDRNLITFYEPKKAKSKS